MDLTPFTAWSKAQGITVNGIEAKSTETTGTGLYTAAPLKEGTEIIFVPASALLTIDSPSVTKWNLPKDSTVHARLAASLTLNRLMSDDPPSLWQQTWPTETDLASMPLSWPTELQDLLPPPTKSLLKAQKKKFGRDVHAMDLFLRQNLDRNYLETFKYMWLIVNSRCFSWGYASNKIRAGDDSMALFPFADFMNHGDNPGIRVKITRQGFTATVGRDHKAGEELFFSYGAHGNDALLVEYGFCLSGNGCDFSALDHLILPKLTKTQREYLKDHGYLGDYSYTAEEVNWRTQIAIRALHPKILHLKPVVNGQDDGEDTQDAVNTEALSLAGDVIDECINASKKINKVCEQAGKRYGREYEVAGRLLITRYKEIHGMATKLFEKLAFPDGLYEEG